MKNRSSWKLFLMLLGFSTGAMGLFTLLKWNLQKKTFEVSIEREIANTGERIAQQIEPSLWNLFQKSMDRKLSKNVVKAIIDAELKNENIHSIVIYGNFGHVFVARKKGEKNIPVNVNLNELLHNENHSIQKFSVRKGKMTIGNVHLYYTQSSLNPLLHRWLKIEVVEIFILNLLFVFFLFVILRQALIKPLLKLTISKKALDSLHESVLITDENNHLIEWNETFLKTTGFKPKDLLGKHPKIISNRLNRKEFWEQMTKINHWSGELIAFKGSGETFPVRLHYSQIYSEEKFICNISTFEDITDEKASRQQLQNTLDLTSQQNDRLKNFAYIVSHNLRSHCSNMEMILNVLEVEEDEEARKKLFVYLSKNVQNLDESIHNLNEVVQIQTETNQSLERLNLYEFCTKIQESLSELILQSEAEIELNFPQETSVWLIPAYLESIILNLVSNFLKYSSPKRRPLLQVEAVETPQYQIIDFADNGIGIDLNKYGDKIFGMYKTFHKNKDAKGLGLFIIKNQIEALGGRIQIQSQVDEGTTFRVWIKKQT